MAIVHQTDIRNVESRYPFWVDRFLDRSRDVCFAVGRCDS